MRGGASRHLSLKKFNAKKQNGYAILFFFTLTGFGF
jgi:hypothetical protein